MILADTSIWIDHMRGRNDRMRDLLNRNEIVIHPFVIGELLLGSLQSTSPIYKLLHKLPLAVQATDPEVLHFVILNSLSGRGIGWVDVHLLAATQLTAGTRLWTRDSSLKDAATDLGLEA